jgi:hypothetical protein
LATKKTTDAPQKNASREELLLEAQRLQDSNPEIVIGRDFWRANAKYPEKMIAKYWSRFKSFLEDAGCRLEVSEAPKEEDLSVEDANLIYDEKYTYNKETDTYITFLDRCKVRIQLSGSQHRAMKDAYSNWSGKPETINEICRTFGMRRDWFIEYKSVHGWTHDSEPVTTEELLTRNEDDMVEDILQKKKQSLYKAFEKKKWRMIQADHEKWQNFDQNVYQPLLAHVQKNLPKYVAPSLNLGKSDEPFAVVLSPFDLHYGKHGWEDETGSSYSRQEAKDLLFDHTTQLGKLIARFGKPEKIICGSGSDWLHIDNPQGGTTRGTPQDCDGTYSQILIEGSELAHDHVEMLRQIAPVEWFPVPGNHDRSSAMTIMLYLQAIYAKSKDVKVVVNPKRRQYTLYGDSLLGFSHGDSVKVGDAHAVMTKEAADLWSQSNYQYWFTGHLHHEVIREIHGLTTIQLKSLSGMDRFHSNNGYITSGRALQAFVVSQDRGIVAQLVSPVKHDVLFGMKIKKVKKAKGGR